jgi:hypothetical protein
MNPDALAGENAGVDANAAEAPLTLASIKEAHEFLPKLRDDELRQIPVLRSGERLEQGATYADLHQRPPREFTAMGGMQADLDAWLVRKTAIGFDLWNRLTDPAAAARR